MDGDNLIADNNRATALSWKSTDSISNLGLIKVNFDNSARNSETILEELQLSKLFVHRFIIMLVLRRVTINLKLDLRVLLEDAFAGWS